MSTAVHTRALPLSASAHQTGTISSSLLGGVRSFHAEAWQRLVHLYGPLVFHWCRQAGLSAQDAEDLGQEVFRAVADRIDQFQRSTSEHTFGGWLRTITRHKVADFWRSRARQVDTPYDPALINNTLTNDFLDSEHDQEEVRGVVYQRALALIRSEFRETSWKAFWATAVEGRATADVAADLDMSTMAVRKAKSRVLRRLREEFAGLGDLDEPPAASS